MLSPNDLKEIKDRIDRHEERSLAGEWITHGHDPDVKRLYDELERVRKIHREEQRRSADRLRKALGKDEAIVE